MLDGEPVRFAIPRDAIDAGIGMVLQHFSLVPSFPSTRTSCWVEPRWRHRSTRRKASRRVRELSERLRAACGPLTRGRAAAGRPAAARRDPEGALPRRAHPYPRRADRSAHAARGDRAVRRSCAASTAQGTPVIFITHKLDEVLDIADRITVLRGGSTSAREPRARRDRGDPRQPHGRPRGRAAVDKPPRSPPSRVSRSRTWCPRRPRPRGRPRASPWRSGRARSWARRRRRQRPSGADRRDRRAARADLRDDRGGRPGHHRRQPAPTCSRPAAATSPPTASAVDWSWTSTSPRTWRSTTSTSRPPRRTAGCSRGAWSRGGATAHRIRCPRRRAEGPRRLALGREPAEGHHRTGGLRDPAVLVASQPTRGLDVGAIEYVHRRLSPSATRVARSSWSRSSWRRSCPSRTASS